MLLYLLCFLIIKSNSFCIVIVSNTHGMGFNTMSFLINIWWFLLSKTETLEFHASLVALLYPCNGHNVILICGSSAKYFCMEAA